MGPDHERWEDTAGTYVLGALPDDEKRQYEAHMATCPVCQAEADELRRQLEEADPPEHVRTVAERELARFERLPPQSAEHGVIRTYLEWMVDLPWSKLSEDRLDVAEARRILDEDHFGLSKVKDRIAAILAPRVPGASPAAGPGAAPAAATKSATPAR